MAEVCEQRRANDAQPLRVWLDDIAASNDLGRWLEVLTETLNHHVGGASVHDLEWSGGKLCSSQRSGLGASKCCRAVRDAIMSPTAAT